MPAAEAPSNDGPPAPEATPGSAKSSKRVVVSEDLPLTLLVAVLTAVVLSIVNAAPQLLWIGVVLAPVLADVSKHWISGRRWSKRRLLGLTGILAGGSTVVGNVRADDKATAAVAPSMSAI